MSGLALYLLYMILSLDLASGLTNISSELLDLGFQLTKSAISLVNVPSSYHSKLDHFLAKITESLDKL